MKDDDFELVRGSGDIYSDFGRPNAGLEQARAVVAAKITRNLDQRKLSTRDAERLTGVARSEFSRSVMRSFAASRSTG
jgi:predicted XRE-type DNA-binding protein